MSGSIQTFECRLIVGLGNPGDEYQGTRHNAGFAAVERFLGRMPKGFEKSKGHKSILWTGRYAGRALLVQEPQTYMNLSGEAVGSLVRVEKIRSEELLAVYDDMDLPLGSLRMRPAGGSGGLDRKSWDGEFSEAQDRDRTEARREVRHEGLCALRV